MGEFAKHNGIEIKIGTCENMYYLREDQRRLIEHKPGNVDVMNPDQLKVLRFRFPWPDEDHEAPGAFDGSFERGLAVNVTFSEPIECEHGMLQFQHRAGLLASLPCPNGKGPHPVKMAKNGYAGDVLLTQQGFRDGELRVICRCGACGYAYNVPRKQAEELAVAIRSEGDRRAMAENRGQAPDANGSASFYHAVADRVLAGYSLQPA